MFGDLFGNMEQQQAELAQKLEAMEVEAQAGEGAIKVTATGTRTIKNISIDTTKVELSDSEQIEDLLLVAINRVLEDAAALEAEESQKLISNMLPPGMDGLFGRG